MKKRDFRKSNFCMIVPWESNAERSLIVLMSRDQPEVSSIVLGAEPLQLLVPIVSVPSVGRSALRV